MHGRRVTTMLSNYVGTPLVGTRTAVELIQCFQSSLAHLWLAHARCATCTCKWARYWMRTGCHLRHVYNAKWPRNTQINIQMQCFTCFLNPQVQIMPMMKKTPNAYSVILVDIRINECEFKHAFVWRTVLRLSPNLKPKTTDRRPTPEDGQPTTNGRRPKTKYQSPKTEDGRPTTKD